METVCQAVDCSIEKIYAKGICRRCYQREYAGRVVERKGAVVANKACKYQGCAEGKHFAKGFCRYHYGWLFKGWMDENGVTNEKCKAKKIYKKCIFPKCPKTNDLRKGLCNKHRKWKERGIVDDKFKMLRDVKQRYGYNAKCKMSGCDLRPRRNGFCNGHSSLFREGRIDASGENSALFRKKRRSYNRDWQCVVCRVKGVKFVLGFCTRHYEDFRKGFIDFNGKVLVKKLRIAKYPENAKCRYPTCVKRPRGQGFCNNHLAQYLNARITINGKHNFPTLHHNKGKHCSVENCADDAKIKGMCPKHYWRKRKTGVAYIESKDNPFWKNVGKTCVTENCGEEAKVRGMCTKHYGRFKRGLPELDKDFYVNKGKSCSKCEQPAKSRGLCNAHYYAWYKAQQSAPLSATTPDIDIPLSASAGAESQAV